MAVCVACLGGGCSAFVCVAVYAAMVGLVVCNHWYACVVSKICCGLVGAGCLLGISLPLHRASQVVSVHGIVESSSQRDAWLPQSEHLPRTSQAEAVFFLLPRL